MIIIIDFYVYYMLFNFNFYYVEMTLNQIAVW